MADVQLPAPRRVDIYRPIVGEASLMRAVSVHHIDLPVAVAFGDKSNLAAIWAEDRFEINCFIVGEASLMRAVSIHHIDLKVAVAEGEKRNLAAVRTEGWVAITRRV